MTIDTERLRKLAVSSNDGYLSGPALQAADEIDRLRADVSELGLEQSAAKIEALLEQHAELTERYGQLIFSVATKFDDESRHETALRYIRERENQPSHGPCEAKNSDTI